MTILKMKMAVILNINNVQGLLWQKTTKRECEQSPMTVALKLLFVSGRLGIECFPCVYEGIFFLNIMDVP